MAHLGPYSCPTSHVQRPASAVGARQAWEYWGIQRGIQPKRGHHEDGLASTGASPFLHAVGSIADGSHLHPRQPTAHRQQHLKG